MRNDVEIKAPTGWVQVSSWNGKGEWPLFKRETSAGTQFLVRTAAGYELRQQGYDTALAKGETVAELLTVADEKKYWKNLRVANYSMSDFSKRVEHCSYQALLGLCNGTQSQAEISRQNIGEVEALMRELRTRLAMKQPDETAASMAERHTAEMCGLVYEFYTDLLYDKTDEAEALLAKFDDILEELRQFARDLRRESRKSKSIQQ